MDQAQNTKPKRIPPLSIRLTKEERALLEQRAGSLSLAGYIKSVVFADNAPRFRSRRQTQELDAKLLAELLAHLGASRVASNLNQIAKHLNQGTLVIDPELDSDLKAAASEVAWIRSTLLQALGAKS
ncbi:hypothetical protein PH5382_03057 [Phaeobacter sp. CECT 5382]|uniref:plasmid mobilization relaxosome protein MobC n=1 Tax=Phaeobacter sp. CECT 5382 TaxID=1712645 RepID=UPI0006DB4458|nr:plasmid mobilization relaxosome protein MobC [Phaeobacter sp. CECT 5382]CUH89111.1 hypothetical protein PH5382_03057 [Phaeobacter sp. CECT 5382]